VFDRVTSQETEISELKEVKQEYIDLIFKKDKK